MPFFLYRCINFEKMNIEEIAYAIASKLDRDIDHGLLQEVKFHVKAAMSKLLHDTIKSNRMPIQSMMSKVVMELTPFGETCPLPIKRSRCTLPMPIRQMPGAPFRSVKTLSNDIVKYMETDSYKMMLHDQFYKPYPFYNVVSNGGGIDIFVHDPNGALSHIVINDVFEYAEGDLATCIGETCKTDYSFPQDLIPALIELVYQGYKLYKPQNNSEIDSNGRAKDDDGRRDVRPLQG